ncbi:cation:proton antiporter [Phaeocystidibacter luteus]|uniref:Cation:proton antiporter n=1 Tax=Phaeocystidibacter luteus TaxID=911197 RepID=A0A6N6RHJ5_9FLAO|nr:cation:proton antiporter [Phaeocystidibacter luteus]KAB2809940.1 cation:proton antiporter [Phaeocystidibacter luteus]
MKKWLPLLCLLFLSTPLTASSGDPYSSEFLAIFFLILGAIFGGFLAKKVNQPPVLGELIIGIVVGTVLYQMNDRVAISIRHISEIEHIIEHDHEGLSWEENVESSVAHLDVRPEVKEKLINVLENSDYAKFAQHARYALLFSSIGVILLLFMVGLETKTTEMLGMGRPALIVAVVGVVFPFIFGYLITLVLMPEVSNNTAIFVGATLGATSIGITARVFKDSNALHLKESKLVLGAAVIDDILGLILLAVVTGIVTSGAFNLSELLIILAKAIGFLVVIYLFERYLIRKSIDIFAKFAGKRTFLFFPVALLMLLAWTADAIGLATIVGAFAAGMVIQEKYFENVKLPHQDIEDLVGPIEEIFAPIFFVMMGFQVDVTAFLDVDIILMGLGITAVAILGKVLAGFFTRRGYNKWLVGVGLIPRGEVGIIFASIGRASGVLDDRLFAVVILVVILTTLLTPPMLNKLIKAENAKIALRKA